MSDEPTKEAMEAQAHDLLLTYYVPQNDIEWAAHGQATRDLSDAIARARLAAIEECAKEMDVNVQAMRNIADTIQRDWILVDGMSSEDRRANALDRREHLNRIPIYESCARQLRALAAPDTPSSGGEG